MWRFSLRILLPSAVVLERVAPRAPIVRVQMSGRDSRAEPRGSGSLPVSELKLTVWFNQRVD